MMSDTGPLEPLLQLLSMGLVGTAVLILAGTARRRARAAVAAGRATPVAHVLVPAVAIAGLLLLTAAWPTMWAESRPSEPSFGSILTWWLGLPALAVALMTFLGSTDPRLLRTVNAPTLGLLDEQHRHDRDLDNN